MNGKNFFIALSGFAFGILSICCAGFLFVLVGVSSLGTAFREMEPVEQVGGNADSKNLVLVVQISGIIMNESSDDPLSSFLSGEVTYGYDIQEELMAAAENEEVKAVIIDVDSPGGTVTGSNAIADGIKYFKEKTGKPVIGFGSGLIASGGYWSIVGSDEVIVDTGSLVGSIGVISGQLTYYNDVIAESSFLGDSVETRGGIQKYYITAGKGKDLGNPYRKPTQFEIELLQEQADNIYDDFVGLVTTNRKGITEVQLRENIGAYVYESEKAVSLKLADRVGSAKDALDAALKAANLSEDDYRLETIPDMQSNFFDDVFGAMKIAGGQNSLTAKTCGLRSQIIVYYGSLAALCKD